MSFAYKSKSTKQKGKSSVNRRKPIKRNSNVQTYNDVRIFYRTPCNNSNDCVQTVKIMEYTYAGKFHSVDSNKQEIISSAVDRAKMHLAKALEDSSVKEIEELQRAIQSVLEIFENPELRIYPLESKDSYGETTQGVLAISVNIDKLYRKISILTKTLIHEAFHIIGGCTGDNDIPCDDGKSKRDAFAEIKDCSIADMNADVFAQFVMRC